ncbi:MAG: transketolase, partial [Oceanospirillum sp.]|nr:transketolase [Oceanospirillum sp.]
SEVQKAFDAVTGKSDQVYQLDRKKPTMIIARTIKGKGVSFLENKDGWHGKPVPQDMLDQALREIGAKDTNVTGEIPKPVSSDVRFQISDKQPSAQTLSSDIQNLESNLKATRQAYGESVTELGAKYTNIIVLDAETSNSTYADKFKQAFPDRYLEMFIAEQNMVSVAVGLARMGYIPFISSFAAFLTRAFDQIRIAQYSESNLKIVGSHAGVSIGYDGSSQMGLEDMGMMKGILESTVLYPSDPVSTRRLVEQLYNKPGIGYLRLTREKTKTLYKPEEEFPVGGSKVLKESDTDTAVIFAAGITVHEALSAQEALQKHNVSVAVVDLYSVKPVDTDTISRLAYKTGKVIVAEDHYPHGGLADSVREAMLSGRQQADKKTPSFTHLCVHEIPHSGKPDELLEAQEINAKAIVEAVMKRV